MKKFLFFLILVLGLQQAVFAETVVISTSESAKIQRHVSEVGFRILNANEIPRRVVFFYDPKGIVNAVAYPHSREIYIYRNLYAMLDDDDMLAAVLGHEISHGVDSYDGIFRGIGNVIAYIHSPKKYEYKADKRAVDYMVKAGYHPVAMIVMMNKSFGQYRYDWNSSHPLTSRRMMEIYEYIYKKYPEYLVNNKYLANPYYQNFLITSKENRAKFENKIETGSTKRVHYL